MSWSKLTILQSGFQPLDHNETPVINTPGMKPNNAGLPGRFKQKPIKILVL